MEKGTGGVSISFTTLLQTAFIVLKLTGVISWSWVWVLAPFWVSVVVAVIALAVLIFIRRCPPPSIAGLPW
jgi:hypothetical protein